MSKYVAFALMAFLAPGLLSMEPKCPNETATYDVKFGIIHVGTATISFGADSTFPSHRCVARLIIRGGYSFYRVNDSYESWFDPATVTSRQFKQTIRDGNYKRDSHYEIFADKGYFRSGADSQPTVQGAVDDISFLFLLRTMSLAVGQRHELSRYFIADRNPVIIDVVRTDTIVNDAGGFRTLVLRPTIKTNGIFREGGRAEVWVTDDSTHRVVQLKSSLRFGSINLYLQSLTSP